MSIRESYEAGTPCWVDLISPDPDASAAFYTAVFGWEAHDQFDDAGTRIYTNFTRGGHLVAGMGGQPPGMGDVPAAWSTYVAVGDVDATAALVEAAGGSVMMPAMDVMTQGRMAIFADPGGAAISVWQAGDHRGAELVNAHAAWSWNELVTRDLEGALPFYADVFGWEYDEVPMPGTTYHLVRGGENGRAGIMAMPDEMPDRVPNHWAVYFTVSDLDAMLAAVTDHGGIVASGPDDVPGIGTMAVVHDPHMGSFSLLQPTAPGSPPDDA